jgi:DNA-binding PadR family transcriptional regulator
MRPDPRDHLPLKDLAFQILLALSDGERHGGNLVQALEVSGGGRVLPGHLYRTLDRMLADGLLEERGRPDDHTEPPNKRGAAPSRFFQLTPLGCDVARAETARLERLVARSRRARLLRPR